MSFRPFPSHFILPYTSFGLLGPSSFIRYLGHLSATSVICMKNEDYHDKRIKQNGFFITLNPTYFSSLFKIFIWFDHISIEISNGCRSHFRRRRCFPYRMWQQSYAVDWQLETVLALWIVIVKFRLSCRFESSCATVVDIRDICEIYQVLFAPSEVNSPINWTNQRWFLKFGFQNFDPLYPFYPIDQ